MPDRTLDYAERGTTRCYVLHTRRADHDELEIRIAAHEGSLNAFVNLEAIPGETESEWVHAVYGVAASTVIALSAEELLGVASVYTCLDAVDGAADALYATGCTSCACHTSQDSRRSTFMAHPSPRRCRRPLPRLRLLSGVCPYILHTQPKDVSENTFLH